MIALIILTIIVLLLIWTSSRMNEPPEAPEPEPLPEELTPAEMRRAVRKLRFWLKRNPTDTELRMYIVAHAELRRITEEN